VLLFFIGLGITSVASLLLALLQLALQRPPHALLILLVWTIAPIVALLLRKQIDNPL